VGGARGAWPPPTPTRIPRRARGARVQALTAPLHTPHGKGVPCPTQTTPGMYGTSARRGPSGCGWAVWPMAITRACSDPALRPARPCAAPSRSMRGARGVPHQHPRHVRHGPDVHAARGRVDRTPVAPTLPCRSQGASTSKKLARLLADLTTPLTKTCGISGLLLVVGSSALLRAHQGRGRLRRRSPPAPSVHTSPLSASRRRRPRARPPPHRMAHTKAHPAPHEWAKVRVSTRDRGAARLRVAVAMSG